MCCTETQYGFAVSIKSSEAPSHDATPLNQNNKKKLSITSRKIQVLPVSIKLIIIYKPLGYVYFTVLYSCYNVCFCPKE